MQKKRRWRRREGGKNWATPPPPPVADTTSVRREMDGFLTRKPCYHQHSEGYGLGATCLRVWVGWEGMVYLLPLYLRPWAKVSICFCVTVFRYSRYCCIYLVCLCCGPHEPLTHARVPDRHSNRIGLFDKYASALRLTEQDKQAM